MNPHAVIQAMQEAVTHQQAGRFAEAEQIYRAILQQNPREPDALQLLGLLYCKVGQQQQAIDLITRAIAIRPEAHFYVNLSVAQRDLGLVLDAIESCRRAVQSAPGLPEAWGNLGSHLQQAGQTEEALIALQRAIELRPDNAVAHNNLANTLSRLGRTQEAADALRRAIDIDPNYAPPYANLAALLTVAGKLDESIDLCRRAIALGSHLGPAYTNLGAALHAQGRFDEGNQAFARAVQLDPKQVRAAENLVSGMCYSTRFSARQIFDAHADWARRVADPLAPTHPEFTNERTADRALRIGYISPDLKRHSVAYFLEPILEHHDRTRFQITAYSDVESPDDATHRLRAHCDRWRDVHGLSDERVADTIRADGIDVLVDLAGHTVGNRLLAMARRPAPVQMTYLGYPATTGMRAIGYRITDMLADPPGASEEFHTERLLRVSAPFVRYRPPAEAPGVVDPPVVRRGFVTFGSFNKAMKVGPETISLWANVLSAVPGSRLMLKATGLSSMGSRTRILDAFAGHGIDPARLNLSEATKSLADHLATYGEVDIALDTFPYHGTTTTCEALWMGVPVLSLVGQTHVSRVALSLLSAIGKPGWYVSSAADFVSLATKSAADTDSLCHARRTLRRDLQCSSLCDYPSLAREVEAFYRQSFRAWCANPH